MVLEDPSFRGSTRSVFPSRRLHLAISWDVEFIRDLQLVASPACMTKSSIGQGKTLTGNCHVAV